jgi:hypothetical protein
VECREYGSEYDEDDGYGSCRDPIDLRKESHLWNFVDRNCARLVQDLRGKEKEDPDARAFYGSVQVEEVLEEEVDGGWEGGKCYISLALAITSRTK